MRAFLERTKKGDAYLELIFWDQQEFDIFIESLLVKCRYYSENSLDEIWKECARTLERQATYLKEYAKNYTDEKYQKLGFNTDYGIIRTFLIEEEIGLLIVFSLLS